MRLQEARHLHFVVVCGVYLALTVLLFFPLSLSPSTRMPAIGPDENLFLWILGWGAHAIRHQPLHIFDANIFFPESQTLAHTENLLGTVLLVMPVIVTSGNLVLAFNVASLSSYVLCGIGAWALARRLGASRQAALLAGVIFSYAPPHFFRSDQIHLATVQWMPLCLAFVHGYANTPRRGYAAAACGFFLLQVLATGHGGVFLSCAVLGLVGFLLARGQWPSLGRTARDFAAPGLLTLGALVWLAAPYVHAREAGLTRTVGEITDASANGASLLAAATHSQEAFLRLIGRPEILQEARTFLFPGWVTLALAGLALIRYRKLPAVMGYYGLLAVFGLWMSLGPPFWLYGALYRLVPGLDFIRVPSRFGILMLLGLAMVAAAGFDAALAGRTARARRVWCVVCLGLLVGEFAAFPIDAPAFAVEVPAVDRWLAGRRGAVVEVPIADPSSGYFAIARHGRYMLHSTVHWLPLVNGHSGWASPSQASLFRALNAFPDESSLCSLEAAGVRYVVVHPAEYRRGERKRADKGFARFVGDRLRLEHEAAGGRIYSLVRSTCIPAATPSPTPRQ